MRMSRRGHFESARWLSTRTTQGLNMASSMHLNQSLNVFLMKNHALTPPATQLCIMRMIMSLTFSSHMTLRHPPNQNSEMVVSTPFQFMDPSNT